MYSAPIKKFGPLLPRLSVMLAIILVILALPRLEADEITPESVHYFVDSSRSYQPIETILRLPSSQWTTNNHRPWLSLLADPQEAWTKLRLPRLPKGAPTPLVATAIFPMHRNIEYYIVQGGVIVQSTTTLPTRPGTANTFERLPSTVEVPSSIVFHGSYDLPQDIYIRSLVFGAGLPLPRVLTLANFAAERTLFNMLTGILCGACLALMIYKVGIGLVTRGMIYLFFGQFLLGISGVAFMASGAAEQLIPSLRTDFNLYSLLTSEAIVVAIAGVHLFKLGFHQLSLTKNHMSNQILLTLFLSLGTCAWIPWVSPAVRPLLLSVLMLALISFSFYEYLRNSHIDIVRQYKTGYDIFSPFFLFSIFTWYELITPNFLRIMSFALGAITSTLYFTSIVAVRLKEIRAKKAQIITQIKQDSRAVAEGAALASGQLPLAFEEAEIAVMFIDIAAFSQLAAPMPSSQVFAQLSQRLGEIAKVIGDFGGNIDRSLGDGLSCFFGYRTGEPPERNTQRAFLAARKIQELTVANVLASPGRPRQQLVMPVRIGVHSCKVMMGNLGGSTRIDFTMIGAGVNFAARLEAACSPFKLMLSSECIDHLRNLGYGADEFSEVGIAIKHKAGLVMSYEYDPFASRASDLRVAERVYFNQLGVQTRDERHLTRKEGTILLLREDDAMIVHDFSRFGFRVTAPRQFGRQACLNLQVRLADNEAMEQLRAKFVDQITVEVRWSKRCADRTAGFEHGLKIVGSSAEQREHLFQQLAARYSVIASRDSELTAIEVA